MKGELNSPFLFYECILFLIKIIIGMKIDALFISDVHLGTKGSNSEMVLEVLKQYEPTYLFLVGDIIDGWMLQKKFRWKQNDTNVIRKILSYSKRGIKVIYITGNHDEFLRQYHDMSFGNIEICDEYKYENTFITHGDLYDGVVKLKWLGILGSIGYDMAISIDRTLKKIGYKRSLSKFLKDSVKEAVKFITSFEVELIRQAKKRDCHTVICGHIHNPEDKIIEDVRYLNCGDWIENNTYIIHHNGKFELIKHATL
jgi:UDP-2,3-diacylglucosamine pyrophosphatase LpxH